ncbi:MAG: hypothetical protein ACI8X5_002366 [Planctomycetota bacterium]|jgi:hypothetical protein
MRNIIRLFCAFTLVVACASTAAASPQITNAGSKNGITSQRIVPPAPEMPAYSYLTDKAQLARTGTALGAVDVEVQGPLNTQLFPVFDGEFTANFELISNTVNHFYLTSISPDGTRSPTALVAITRDNQAPNLFIDLPLDGAEVTTPTVDVAGRVGDLLGGFDGLDVFVNGMEAEVDIGIGQNGTFFLSNLVLDPVGAPTLITVVATDSLRNQAVRVINVSQITIPVGSPEMQIVSGDDQTGMIATLLPQPATVVVTRGDGTPFDGKVVTFQVTRSDGKLSSVLDGTYSTSVQVIADAGGVATVFWRLGSDAGCGNNRVEVTSTDVVGTTLFFASAAPGSAALVQVGTGNNQSGETGGPSNLPLRAWVNDNCNGVEGVQLTFSVVEGGGLVDGLTQVTVPSTATGHAFVQFNFGPSAGSNRVEVDFAGNLGSPAVFLLNGVKRDEDLGTRFRGLVVDDGGRVLEGASVILSVAGQSRPVVLTDSYGQFEILDISQAGAAHLELDGGTATAVNGQPIPLLSFPKLGFQLILVEGAWNSLPTPIVLPPLDPANQVVFDNTADVILRVNGIAGLEMIVRAGSVTLANGDVPDAQTPVTLSLNQVDFDEIPMPLPDGAAAPFAWTLQPGGTHFDPPVEVRMPNMVGLAPGAIAYFLSFNHSTERFDIVASGSVTEDGGLIVTDPGAGIATAGWGGFCPPYPCTTEVTGEANTAGWEESGSFIVSMLSFMQLTEAPCKNLLDGSIAGLKSYRDCVSNAVACARNSTTNAITVPGTSSGGFIFGLGTAAVFGAKELGNIVNDAYNSPEPESGVVSVEILSETVWEVPTEVPSKFAEWTARVYFDFPQPNMIIGDAVQIIDLSQFDFAAMSELTMTVMVMENPSQALVEGTFIEVTGVPIGTVRVGGQSAPIRPDGSFSVPNVPATIGTPIRPRLLFEGLEVQLDAAPLLFMEPICGGVTKFGEIPLEPEPLYPLSLHCLNGITVLNQLGQSWQLQIQATMTDNSLLDVSSSLYGTCYTSSNPAIVSVDSNGLVTAAGNGSTWITVCNQGTTCVSHVISSLGDPLTTVVGFVTLGDGAPVAGANVSVTPSGLSDTTSANGHFSIPNVPTFLGDLTVFANHQVGPNFLFGFVTDIVPVPGGLTDAGVIQIDDTVYWIDNVSGSWNDPARWSTGSVPGLGDNVVIDRPGGEYTINLGGAVATVNSLRCEEMLVIDSGSLTVIAPFQVNNSFTMTGGTLANSRVLPGFGSSGISVSGGTLDDMEFDGPLAFIGNGTKTLVGQLTLNGLTTMAQGTLAGGTIDGTTPLNVTGSSTLNGVTLDTDVQVANSISLTIQNGLTLNSSMTLGSTSWGRLHWSGTQTLDGIGVINMSNVTSTLSPLSGTLTIESGIEIEGYGRMTGPWVNRGTIRNSTSSSLRFDGSGWVNEGLIEASVPGGSLILSGTGWSNAATGTMLLNDTTASLSGTYTQNGALTANNAVVNLGGSFTLANLGVLSLTSTQLNQTGTLTNNAPGGLDVGSFGTEWRLNGGTIIGGSVNGTSTLMVVGSSTLIGVTLDTDVQVANSISLTIQNGLTLNSSMTLGSTSWGRLHWSGTQTLDGIGVINMSNVTSTLSPLSGTLTIESGIEIEGYGRMTGPWVNRGTVRNSTSSSLRFDGSGWVNEGLIEATSTGDIIWSGSGTNDGTIALGFASQLTGSASFVQGAMGILRLEIGGTAAGQFGRVSMSSTGSLDGGLEATAVNGFAPAAGNTFQVVSTSSQSGIFSSVNCTNFSCTTDYSSGNSVVLSVL